MPPGPTQAVDVIQHFAGAVVSSAGTGHSHTLSFVLAAVLSWVQLPTELTRYRLVEFCLLFTGFILTKQRTTKQ